MRLDGWSHIIELLPLKQPLERKFYTEMWLSSP